MSAQWSLLQLLLVKVCTYAQPPAKWQTEPASLRGALRKLRAQGRTACVALHRIYRQDGKWVASGDENLYGNISGACWSPFPYTEYKILGAPLWKTSPFVLLGSTTRRSKCTASPGGSPGAFPGMTSVRLKFGDVATLPHLWVTLIWGNVR